MSWDNNWGHVSWLGFHGGYFKNGKLCRSALTKNYLHLKGQDVLSTKSKNQEKMFPRLHFNSISEIIKMLHVIGEAILNVHLWLLKFQVHTS